MGVGTDNRAARRVLSAVAPSLAASDALVSLDHRKPKRVSDLLAWDRIGYPRSARLWANGEWTLAVGNQVDRWVELKGPGYARHWDVPDKGYYVDDVYLDDHWAVFGVHHLLEHREVPPTYTVINLSTRTAQTIDRQLVGKAIWTNDYLGGRLLVDVRRQGQWCLGYLKLTSLRLLEGPCPDPGTSFASGRLTDVGLSASQYDPRDDQESDELSCVKQLDLSVAPPVRFPGTARCWPRENAMLVTGGYLWSQPTRPPGSISPSRFYAVSGAARYDLGTGGGATWCDGAAYFTSDAKPARRPAQVVRWEGDGTLTAVYQAKPGDGVGPVWCAGDHLVVQSSGDFSEPQLMAPTR